MFFCWRVLMVAPRLMSGRKMKIFKRVDKVNCVIPAVPRGALLL